MRDRLLTYAVLASIFVHLALLGLVGKTSAAKPIEVEHLKIVRVDLLKTPEPVVHEDRHEPPKPKVVEPPKPESPQPQPAVNMVESRRPVPRPVQKREPVKKPPVQPNKTATRPERTTVAKLPGDPGGALGGITAPNGDDMGRVEPGGTPVGWVPGPSSGRGAGSGTGAGVGRPDPVPDAHPGPGLEPAPPPPPPPPPPQPKIVNVRVCAVSGALPGPHCEKKTQKSFREGSEPHSVCGMCKPPEPKHVSTLADRREPELVRDSQPRIPDIDQSGEYIVRIRYTVNTDGSVSDVEVADSSGIPAIDRAILDSARKMHYKPAVQNGVPRNVKIKRKYRIRL